MFLIFLLILLGGITLSIVGYSLKYGISPMPTSRRAKRVICSLVPSSSGNIYELGSGWGTLAFSLARLQAKSHIHAYEISPIPFFISKGVNRFSNLTIVREDFFNVSLKMAEGVVCYLYPRAMEQLKEKFERELKPGTFVITNSFAIPGWLPEKVIEVDDLWRSKIFFYRY